MINTGDLVSIDNITLKDTFVRMFYWYVDLIPQVTVHFAKFDNNSAGLILIGFTKERRIRCKPKNKMHNEIEKNR